MKQLIRTIFPEDLPFACIMTFDNDEEHDVERTWALQHERFATYTSYSDQETTQFINNRGFIVVSYERLLELQGG